MNDGVSGVAHAPLPPAATEAEAENAVRRDPGVADPQGVSQAAQNRPAQRAAGSGLRVDAPDSAFVNLAVEGDDGATPPPALALPKKMNAEQLVLLLYAMQSKMGLETVKESEARIESQKLEREEKHEETLNKIEEMEKAREKAKNSSKIGKIFGWIGVGLAWLAVGVVAVASGGAAAAPLAVAATAMTAMMIAQETGATEKAMEAMNLSGKDAMIFQISMAVALLVVNLIAMVMSFGAASGGVASAGASVAGTAAQTSSAATSGGATTAAAATSTASTATAAATSTASTTAATASSTASTTAATAAASTASTASTSATTTAGQAASTSAKVVQTANKLRIVAQLAQAAGQAGGAGTQAATGAYNYQASNAQADADEARADLARIQEITMEELHRIRKLLQQMQESRAAVNDIISNSNQTASKIATPA